MHIAEVVTIAKSLPLLRLNTYKSLILSYSADYRRILRKNNADDYSVECRNQKMEVSSRLLRSLALHSESPGKIVLSSHYYHVLVYTDLYGRILYSNINLDALFNKK